MSPGVGDQDLRIKKLKRSLEGWREIILNLNSVLMWEKQWHAGAIFGALTFIFLCIWFMDPSILSAFSILGLVVTVADYLVPTLAASIFRNDLWTGAKEKKFDDICRNLVIYYTQLSTLTASYYLMRTVRPKIFYSTLIGTLLLLAWLGSSMNNLFLTYVFVLIVAMLPGLEHQGFISKYGGFVTSKFKEITKKTKGENDVKED